MKRNLNHYALPAICNEDMKERISYYREHPYQYIQRIYSNFVYMDLPPYINSYTQDSTTGWYGGLQRMGTYGYWYDVIFYGSWFRNFIVIHTLDFVYRPSLFIFILILLLLLSIRLAINQKTEPIQRIFYFLSSLMFLWFLAMILLIDGKESNRMRWDMEGIYLSILVERCYALYQSLRIHKPNNKKRVQVKRSK